MTKKNLSALVTSVSLITAAVALSQNAGSGFFSNDYGLSVFSHQGAIGLFIATGNGCPPNGFYAECGLIDSYAGLVSLTLLRQSEGGLSFQIPGVIWLLAMGLLCFWAFRSARRSDSNRQMQQAEQAAP